MNPFTPPLATIIFGFALVSSNTAAYPRQDTVAFTGATPIDGTGTPPVSNATVVVGGRI